MNDNNYRSIYFEDLDKNVKNNCCTYRISGVPWLWAGAGVAARGGIPCDCWFGTWLDCAGAKGHRVAAAAGPDVCWARAPVSPTGRSPVPLWTTGGTNIEPPPPEAEKQNRNSFIKIRFKLSRWYTFSEFFLRRIFRNDNAN